MASRFLLLQGFRLYDGVILNFDFLFLLEECLVAPGNYRGFCGRRSALQVLLSTEILEPIDYVSSLLAGS